MARVNCGIDPQYLSDQHLIAESVEITMITGSLRRNKYEIKSPIPEQLNLGKGHINFFKNKILYLQSRLRAVNLELDRRGIRNSTQIRCGEFPDNLIWGWEPEMRDSIILRERIYDRLLNPRKAKPGFHRYYEHPIENMEEFANRMKNSPLYHV
jgi:hypothetical protein